MFQRLFRPPVNGGGRRNEGLQTVPQGPPQNNKGAARSKTKKSQSFVTNSHWHHLSDPLTQCAPAFCASVPTHFPDGSAAQKGVFIHLYRRWNQPARGNFACLASKIFVQYTDLPAPWRAGFTPSPGRGPRKQGPDLKHALQALVDSVCRFTSIFGP